MPTDKEPFKPDTELKAPKGKYRVVGVDTFNLPYTDSLVGDFDTREEAEAAAYEYGGQMNPAHVYDDEGNHLFQVGSA